MTKIVVDGRPLDGTKNGYAAYTEWVVSVLQARGHDVRLVSNRPVMFKAYATIRLCPVDMMGAQRSMAWEQIDLRRYLAQSRPDVYFCGQNIGLPLLYQGPTRLVLGLLDMIPQRFPRTYIRSGRDKLRYRFMQTANARKADQIVTISKASQADIKQYMKVSKVEAVYIRQSAPARVAHRPLPARPHFVYVGGVEWRKRVDTVIRAFELFLDRHPDSVLSLIGDGYTETVKRLTTAKLRRSIKLPGVLSQADRNAQIRKATALVFPSLYEGYGLPIAEAFLQGVPVICGTGGSQPEIGGHLATYIDPADEHTVVAAMKMVNTAAYRTAFQDKLPAHLKFLCDPLYDEQLECAIVGHV